MEGEGILSSQPSEGMGPARPCLGTYCVRTVRQYIPGVEAALPAVGTALPQHWRTDPFTCARRCPYCINIYFLYKYFRGWHHLLFSWPTKIWEPFLSSPFPLLLIPKPSPNVSQLSSSLFMAPALRKHKPPQCVGWDILRTFRLITCSHFLNVRCIFYKQVYLENVDHHVSSLLGSSVTSRPLIWLADPAWSGCHEMQFEGTSSTGLTSTCTRTSTSVLVPNSALV